MHVSEACLKTA